MSIEIEGKILGSLAHTEGKTSPDIYLCLGDLVVKEGIQDLAKEYLYPLKDSGSVEWGRGVWKLTPKGYVHLNLLRQEADIKKPLQVVGHEHFVPTDHYKGEDLRPVAGRAGAFDYREKASRFGNEFVPYMVARSLNSPVRKEFLE